MNTPVEINLLPHGKHYTITVLTDAIRYNREFASHVPVLLVRDDQGQSWNGHELVAHHSDFHFSSMYYDTPNPLLPDVEVWLETGMAVRFKTEDGRVHTTLPAEGERASVYVDRAALKRGPHLPALGVIIDTPTAPHAEEYRANEVELARTPDGPTLTRVVYRPDNPLPTGERIWIETNGAIDLYKWAERPADWPVWKPTIELRHG